MVRVPKAVGPRFAGQNLGALPASLRPPCRVLSVCLVKERELPVARRSDHPMSCGQLIEDFAVIVVDRRIQHGEACVTIMVVDDPTQRPRKLCCSHLATRPPLTARVGRATIILSGDRITKGDIGRPGPAWMSATLNVSVRPPRPAILRP